jgi:hypothetical protein
MAKHVFGGDWTSDKLERVGRNPKHSDRLVLVAKKGG